MPNRFPVGLPLERAWTRRVLCAAEIVDAVTLQPVITDIKVRAEGLKSKPRISRSGYHYWLEEGGAQPQRIFVDASGTPYGDAESAPPVPPKKSVRIELVPRFSYPFAGGTTAAARHAAGEPLRRSAAGRGRDRASAVVRRHRLDQTRPPR